MPNSYPRDDALGLLDTPHLRCVQNKGGLALDLLAEAVRVQHLVDIRVRTRRGGTGGHSERLQRSKAIILSPLAAQGVWHRGKHTQEELRHY